MSERPRLPLVALVVVLALIGAGLAGAVASRSAADGAAGSPPADGSARSATADGRAGSPRAAAALPDYPDFTDEPGGARWRAERTAEARRGRWTAHLTRAALLRATPDGRRVTRVSRRTGYGATRVYAVAALRAGWIGVRALQRPNDRLAWLPEDAVRLQPIRTTLVADLSDRELTVRVDGEIRDRARVGVGRPGSETPVGRYGVTDRLRSGEGALRGAYGCCVLPLTGHQTRLPPGWTGGTRLALHATPSTGTVGQEVSAGCLRLREEDMRRVLKLVPLGATLTVRR